MARLSGGTGYIASSTFEVELADFWVGSGAYPWLWI